MDNPPQRQVVYPMGYSQGGDKACLCFPARERLETCPCPPRNPCLPGRNSPLGCSPRARQTAAVATRVTVTVLAFCCPTQGCLLCPQIGNFDTKQIPRGTETSPCAWQPSQSQPEAGVRAQICSQRCWRMTMASLLLFRTPEPKKPESNQD